MTDLIGWLKNIPITDSEQFVKSHRDRKLQYCTRVQRLATDFHEQQLMNLSNGLFATGLATSSGASTILTLTGLIGIRVSTPTAMLNVNA